MSVMLVSCYGSIAVSTGIAAIQAASVGKRSFDRHNDNLHCVCLSGRIYKWKENRKAKIPVGVIHGMHLFSGITAGLITGQSWG